MSAFGDLPLRHYGVILADPAWLWQGYTNKIGPKSTRAQYACEPLDAIKALPVADLAKPDCALIVWGLMEMLPEAIELIRAWGFRYVTGGGWYKVRSRRDGTAGRTAFGKGKVLRNALEVWLIGFRGHPRIRSRSIRNAICAPTRGHSRKPDDIYGIARRLFAGPYLELNARQRVDGWDAWGNEAGKFGRADLGVDLGDGA